MERLYRKLEEYSRSDYYPFHMPGHKRNPVSVRGEFPLERDITEIEGFDNLHHPEDLLLEAQQNVAKLYGTRESFYSVNGVPQHFLRQSRQRFRGMGRSLLQETATKQCIMPSILEI